MLGYSKSGDIMIIVEVGVDEYGFYMAKYG